MPALQCGRGTTHAAMHTRVHIERIRGSRHPDSMRRLQSSTTGTMICHSSDLDIFVSTLKTMNIMQ